MLEKNKTRGITLISLVITVVVLLILAGVAIYAIADEEGIIRQAQKSQKVMSYEIIKEKIQLAMQEYKIEKYINQSVALVEFMESKEWCSDAIYDEDTNDLIVTMENTDEHYIYFIDDDEIEKIEGVGILTVKELKEALANGEDALLGRNLIVEGITDSNGEYLLKQENGGVVDGNGKTLTLIENDGIGIYSTGGTIQNITLAGEVARSIGWCSLESDLILKNINFRGNNTYAIHVDRGNGHNFIASDCNIRGVVACSSSLNSVSYTNCTFEGANGYNYINVYSPTTFTNCKFIYDGSMYNMVNVTNNFVGTLKFSNCEFVQGYVISPTTQPIIFENCKHNGVLITSENVADLLDYEDITELDITINNN